MPGTPPPTGRGRGHGDPNQSLDKSLWVEHRQVARGPPDPHYLDGDVELLLNRQNNAAPRRGIEIGQDGPGRLHRLGQTPGPGDAVLPRRGIDYEEGLGHDGLALGD